MKLCDFCENPENPVDTDDEDNYVQVVSWVNGPKLDGPKLRMQTGRVAHEDCVKRAVAGQAPPDEQPDLFEEVKPHKVVLCDAEAIKGTGTGICGSELYKDGSCPRASLHLP